MIKKVLIVAGSPQEGSFSSFLAETYAKSAKEKFETRLHSISQMSFDENLASGYTDEQTLEPDLEAFQHSLLWAEHVVIVTPIWWGSLPAKLKGLIDRTLLPDFAFKYIKGKSAPKKLLINKTARIIMTMDTPPWYYRFIQGAPALKQLKIATLEFSGFKSVKNTMLGPVMNSSTDVRKNWVEQVSRLGMRAK